ncbi:MAG: hypothetical protein K2R98_15955 [Gemmataceae bacterium]|nr:hypothetical protein [Gemmataceae bacterium]
MWHWIKRWRDWVMLDLWPMHRIGARPQALHYSYEKAGLTVHDQPIPWNAEAVVVEALLQSRPGRRKSDFALSVPNHVPIAAENLRRDEGEDRHHLFFRLPTPAKSTTVELLWKNTSMAQLTLPVLSHDEFVKDLRLHMPTLFVRLGDQNVACETFVSTQCRGLLASAVLMSPTSLAPLLDMNLHVEFRCERSGATCDAPVQLSSSQLGSRQALVTVVPRKVPRRIGTWTATWKLGTQTLATQRVRAISTRTFQRSLRVCDTRFVVQTKEGVSLRRQVPALNESERVGPCFLIASGEAGMAGICNLSVSAQGGKSRSQPLLLEQDILVSDGPTMFAPGTVQARDLHDVSAFELKLKAKVLGVLSLCPAPTASFTSEGGFKAPDEFLWSAAAEEELNDRLGKLLEGPAN